MARDHTEERLTRERNKVIAAAEKNLQRLLTFRERRVIEGFDRSLVLYQAYVEAFSSWKPQEILALFDRIAGDDSPVTLLDSLAPSSRSISADRVAILQWLKPKARTIVERFDFEKGLRQFGDWFLESVRANRHPRELRR